ncbi:MAG: LysR substrate-binding domain-containing protein, partial [Pseudomonadota bacterium]
KSYILLVIILFFRTRISRMITFKQLNYALAVARHLHFKKAAEECGVSQSALSTALSELEKQLAVRIFERDNKKVLLTTAGRLVLDKAQSIKLAVDDLQKVAEAQQPPLSFPLTIGVIPTIAPFLLPTVLPAIRKSYPALSLNVVESTSTELVAGVRDGDLDTAILALPFDIEGLLSFEFMGEDFYWVSHKRDSQPGVKEISAAELEDEKLLLLKDGHCLKDQALEVCDFAATSRHELSATSLNTLIQMVRGRLGSTLVPEMALDQLLSDQSELQAVHLNEPSPHRRIAFIIRPNYAGLNNIELLIELFRKQTKLKN